MQDPHAAAALHRAFTVAYGPDKLRPAIAVTYSTLSDVELKRYVAFAETPAGRRYHAATWTALDAALSDAAADAGRLLATVRST